MIATLEKKVKALKDTILQIQADKGIENNLAQQQTVEPKPYEI